MVVVGQFTLPALSPALRLVAVEPVPEAAAVAVVVVVVVDSKPFTCSNDSSVFVDLSAVVLADVLVVVHFITGRGLLVTLLELLLVLLLLLLALA